MCDSDLEGNIQGVDRGEVTHYDSVVHYRLGNLYWKVCGDMDGGFCREGLKFRVMSFLT